MTTTEKTNAAQSRIAELLDMASTRRQTGSYAGAAMLYDRVRIIMSQHMIGSVSHNGRTYSQADVVRLVREYNHA